jgi:hypothetical protein
VDSFFRSAGGNGDDGVLLLARLAMRGASAICAYGF